MTFKSLKYFNAQLFFCLGLPLDPFIHSDFDPNTIKWIVHAALIKLPKNASQQSFIEIKSLLQISILGSKFYFNLIFRWPGTLPKMTLRHHK